MISEWTEPVWVYEDFIRCEKGEVNTYNKNEELRDRFPRQDLGKEENIEHAQGSGYRY